MKKIKKATPLPHRPSEVPFPDNAKKSPMSTCPCIFRHFYAVRTRMLLVEPAVASFAPCTHTTLSPVFTHPCCLPRSIALKTMESVPIIDPITCVHCGAEWTRVNRVSVLCSVQTARRILHVMSGLYVLKNHVVEAPPSPTKSSNETKPGKVQKKKSVVRARESVREESPSR